MTNGQQFTGLRNVWNPCEMFRFKSNVSAGFFHVKPVTATVHVNDGLFLFFTSPKATAAKSVHCDTLLRHADE